MELTSDVKFVIAILVATVLVIGGGAYIASTKVVDPAGRIVSDSLVDRLVQDDSQTVGPKDAKVNLVEFADFECPSCGAVHPLLKEIKNKYADKSVQFVFRNYPLPQHANAFLAAEAAAEAGKQNKFWEFHDTLFENQQKLTKEDLISYAEKAGLDVQAFTTALDSNAHKEFIQRDMSDGKALGIKGTPTIFINNREYNGKYSLDSLSSAIDEALAK